MDVEKGKEKTKKEEKKKVVIRKGCSLLRYNGIFVVLFQITCYTRWCAFGVVRLVRHSISIFLP